MDAGRAYRRVVLASDYDVLAAENERLRAQVAERDAAIEGWFGTAVRNGMEVDRLNARIAELNEVAEHCAGVEQERDALAAEVEALRTCAALAEPVAGGVVDPDQLAQIIREIDGNHSLGAGALAEAIFEKLAALNGDEVYGQRERLRAQIAERDALRRAKMDDVMQRAAGCLPEGYELRIELERGAGWCELYRPDGSQHDQEFEGDTLAEQVNEAIDAAMAQEKSNGTT
jgi:hypothetical protein